MNGEQIRSARALLGWTAADLAEMAGVSYPTVQRLDATKGAVEAIEKAGGSVNILRPAKIEKKQA